jgi:acetyl-CoA carboxylase carboxyltransferase component
MVCFTRKESLRGPTQRKRTSTRYCDDSGEANAARDRVRLLLDADTPFLELGCFAGFKLDTSSPGASLITGIGVIRFVPEEKLMEVV